MIQFAIAVFSENSPCMLEFSILVKMLHNFFGHNTNYVISLVFCFAACLPATVLHDLLRDKFLGTPKFLIHIHLLQPHILQSSTSSSTALVFGVQLPTTGIV